MLREQDRRYEGKMSVYDKRDKVITCVFLLNITPGRALKESLCEVSEQGLETLTLLKTKTVIFSVLSLLIG